MVLGEETAHGERAMSVLPRGEMENVHLRRCQQTQCSFFLQGGCRACDDCAAAPYEIRKSCSRCFNCENVPDHLRWDDKNLISIGQKQTNPQQPNQRHEAPEILVQH